MMAVWMDGVKMDETIERYIAALAEISARQEETNRLLRVFIVGLTPLAPDLAAIAAEGGQQWGSTL